MKIRFLGVRGSIPAPMTNAVLVGKINAALRIAVQNGLRREEDIPDFIRSLPWWVRRSTGGETPCIELTVAGKRLVFDAGTGLRRLGLELVREYGNRKIEVHILLSHTHWDHISGIPFFAPGYNPNNSIRIYSPITGLEEIIRGQQASEYFPVPLAPAFRFVRVKPRGSFRIGDIKIETMPLKHPGSSYAFRVSYMGKSVVYATDSEYKDLSVEALEPFTEFFLDSDILIFDAQYTMLENFEKEDWGHSNAFVGIDMALESGVRNLFLTHHDPNSSDRKIQEIKNRALEYLEIHQSDRKLKVHIAYEGLTIHF